MAGDLQMSQEHGRLRKFLPCYHRMPGDSHGENRTKRNPKVFYQAACMLLAGV